MKLVTNFIAILQWGNKGREGEEEVDYDNILCAYYKKGGKTSKSKILRIWYANIGIANMYRRQGMEHIAAR